VEDAAIGAASNQSDLERRAGGIPGNDLGEMPSWAVFASLEAILGFLTGLS
jgi:hypothetical protein